MGSKNMWSDFKAFIAGGNVLDLAVGVMIGGAFATITKSLTEDLLMPVVSALFGGVDFSSRFFIMGSVPDALKEAAAAGNYAALKAAGVPMLGYGAFITAIINFLIFAFVIFMLVRWVNKVLKTKVAQAGPTEVDLLTEIRDSLKK
jgi:large conductance mechanosensitive channel